MAFLLIQDIRQINLARSALGMLVFSHRFRFKQPICQRRREDARTQAGRLCELQSWRETE